MEDDQSIRKITKPVDYSCGILYFVINAISPPAYSPLSLQPQWKSECKCLSCWIHVDWTKKEILRGNKRTPLQKRHNIQVLQRVVKKWNDHENLKFAINVRDIVDGFCPKPESLNVVQKVVKQFETSYCPVYHMIGNHCLYNLPRKDLLPMLKMSTANDQAYYDFSQTPNYRFVVLDGYDISAISWSHDHPKTMEALKILQENNPNSEKNSPAGMVGVERRFFMFNGAIGKEQLEWLDKILQVSTKHEEKVVVCCHMALDPGATSYEALCCNYDEVMEVIHIYKYVQACIAGHDHKGGHSIDSHGVHHRPLEAALECPPGSDAFGYIDAYPDKLSLFGTDRYKY